MVRRSIIETPPRDGEPDNLCTWCKEPMTGHPLESCIGGPLDDTIGPACERGGEIVDYTIGLCSCGQCPTPRADWCGCIDVMSGQPGRDIDTSGCPVHGPSRSRGGDREP
jgi:hypothetical protein